MTTLPFTTARLKRRALWRSWPWRGAAPVIVAVAAWWGLAGMSGVTTITPADHGPVLPLAEPFLAETDWSGWRGGSRQGTLAASTALPVQWALPDGTIPRIPNTAVSPPIVVGDAIYFTRRSVTQGHNWLTCVDRTSGDSRWQATFDSDEGPPRASLLPTPACDGSRLFVTSATKGQFLVTAYDADGAQLWSQSVGPIGRAVGPGQSPVVSGSLVFVSIDQRTAPWDWSGSGGYVAAVHRQTGQIVWRTPRSGGDGAATPVVATLAGRRQLILPGRGRIQAYDAETGRELWMARWPTRAIVGAVVCDDQHVFATTTGTDRETLCVRADGNGDVTETHVLWRAKNAGSGASPVLIDGNVIVAQENGGVTALDRLSGRVVWQQQLAGRFTTAPLAAGSRVYCLDDTGGVTVLDASQHGQVIAHNRSTGPHTVAVSGDQWLFVSSAGLTIVGANGPTQIAHGDLPSRDRH